MELNIGRKHHKTIGEEIEEFITFELIIDGIVYRKNVKYDDYLKGNLKLKIK